MIYTYSIEKVYTTRVRQYVELETNDAQAMNTFLIKLQDSNITNTAKYKKTQSAALDDHSNLEVY